MKGVGNAEPQFDEVGDRNDDLGGGREPGLESGPVRIRTYVQTLHFRQIRVR